MQVVVIGGGPAGMMAAITASETGGKVILIEKMQSLGRKLLITGKGRCNITSSLSMENFIKNVPGNGKFLYSAFNNFTNTDIINFLKSNGLEVKEERGHRIFPVTDNSKDVLNCFIKRIKQLNIRIMLNTKVVKINIDKATNCVKSVETEDGNIVKAEKVILATGGKSYPLTGSTGDGYELAQKLGHTITALKPSLVPLEAYEKEMCKNMQGLSLKNVKVKFVDLKKGKIIYEDFGEMLFTHFGVSGPIILSSTAHLIRYKNVCELLQEKQIELTIDLKPALSEEKLDKRILRDFEKNKNKSFKNSLNDLLPQKLTNNIIDLSKIDPNKKVNGITKEERRNLVILLKNFKIKIKNFRPIDEAIITSGGINIKEIDPKTMQSKLVKGLFFAGEIIDVDAYTGGFNLQIAYSTGYTAGGGICKNF